MRVNRFDVVVAKRLHEEQWQKKWEMEEEEEPV